MAHNQPTPHREERISEASVEAGPKSPLILGMKRPIQYGSYFARILQEITPMLQQMEANEYGRLIREGKARAKAERLAAQLHGAAELDKENDSRP